MSYLHRFSDERSPHPRLGGQAGPADQAGNARPATIPRRMRLLMWVGLALALTAGAAWLGHSLALRTALDQLHADAQKRLDVIAARLDGELARFDYLPSLLETTPEVFELLAAPDDMGLRQRVSRHLRGITATAGADNLYVTNRAGLTVAAADAGQPGTPLGTDLSFRPYVRDALAYGRGRFFGVGFTTGRTGYYLAYALQQGGTQRGVATVKVSLDAVQRTWAQLPGDVLVLDARDVVILASQGRWRMRPLTALSPALSAEAAEHRTYGNADLAALDWQLRERLDEQTQRVRLDGIDYLASEGAANLGLWRIVLLDDETPARAAARNAALSAALACAVLMLLIVAVAQRRRALRQQQVSRLALQAAHDSLEARVVERTAELRALQNDLIHAGKLAALGQMSAGMVHELNQPLAAMRTLSDNASVLLDKGRLDDARGNLKRIASLTDRLGGLTRQLKVFAHKSPRPTQRVMLKKVVHDALLVVDTRLRELGAAVTVAIEPESLSVPADEARLEQVLVNLFGNAADAMSAAAKRQIGVRGIQDGERVRVVIADSGSGIDPQVLPQLFEPFVTTKPAGKGLGLGLMISAHIVREFGGHLSARNLEPCGAEFVIDLPATSRAAGAQP